MKLFARVLAAVAVATVLFVTGGDVGSSLAALPLVITLTCTGIDVQPQAAVDATSTFAWVEFEVNDADNEIHIPKGFPLGKFWVRITEAQKDDFTVGSSYDIDITAT